MKIISKDSEAMELEYRGTRIIGPSKAKYVTTDADGTVRLHSELPQTGLIVWTSANQYLTSNRISPPEHWRTTLETVPDPDKEAGQDDILPKSLKAKLDKAFEDLPKIATSDPTSICIAEANQSASAGPADTWLDASSQALQAGACSKVKTIEQSGESVPLQKGTGIITNLEVKAEAQKHADDQTAKLINLFAHHFHTSDKELIEALWEAGIIDQESAGSLLAQMGY